VREGEVILVAMFFAGFFVALFGAVGLAAGWGNDP
jgi:hypothetical protein